MAIKSITYGNLGHVFTSYRINISRDKLYPSKILREYFSDTFSLYLHIFFCV